MGKPTIAFLGLGVMGYPMAGHLAAAGYPVCAYNRTAARAAEWLRQFGEKYQVSTASTPSEAASQAELVFVCVGNDADVRQVVKGPEGALAGMGRGGVLVDHTTTSAQLAQELGPECSERGIDFLDAPVSGGQSGANSGQLTVMVGGEQSVFQRVFSALDCYARQAKLIGPCGSGQLCKMVNQICIAGLLQGLSEGLRFGEQVGLDMHQVIEVISQGAAQSWQMDHRAVSMLAREFDFGFAVDWMRKDLGFCLDEAARRGISLDFTRQVDERYQAVQSTGGGRLDTSSLIKLL